MKIKAHLHLPKMKRKEQACISVAPFVQTKGEATVYFGTLTLRDVRFKVSQPGRKRTVEQKVRNVHAWVVGEMLDGHANQILPTHKGQWREAYYNPYKTETFVDKQSGVPLATAKAAYMVGDKVFYIPE